MKNIHKSLVKIIKKKSFLLNLFTFAHFHIFPFISQSFLPKGRPITFPSPIHIVEDH